MTKMEKELIEKLERACQTEARVTLRLIRKLQKELEEKTIILMAGADKVKQLEKENKKLEKVIKLLHNLFYEYISIRPMSGIKFLNDKGITNCKICEKDLENGISCKECIKQQIFKKVGE